MEKINFSFRKFSLMLLSVFLMFGLALPIHAEEDQPSRDIYVVYDDSGSMYQDYSKNENDPSSMLDRWSYALYSMEVFASMLGPEDTMKIYYMSDYSLNGNKNGPKITLSGDADTQKNIDTIHNQKTSSGNTPFQTVEAAYDDLLKAKGDEKWLIVLSDGEFRDTEGSEAEQAKLRDELLASKNEDIHVVFLGLGDDADPIEEVTEEDIYYEEAKDNTEILEKVTEISNRVFNMNRLNVDADDGEFSLDVPMTQLTFFVQGNKAKVLSLKNSDGKEVGTMQKPVTVSATEKSDNDLHPDNKPVEELYGEIVVFDGDFVPGDYRIETENASKIEVYYKPNLQVSAYLTNQDGDVIENFSDLPTGDYTVHFDLVSGLDGSKLPQRNIVSGSEYGVQYEATVKNNGTVLSTDIQDNEKIHVDNGNLDIDVTATFLKYNTVHTDLSYNIFSDKHVVFELADNSENETWKLDSSGLQTEEPLKIQMLVEHTVPTEEEWAQVQIPEIKVISETGRLLNPPVIEKSEIPGIFLLQPDSSQDEFTGADYSSETIQISMDQTVNSIPWQGSSDIEVKISDDRSWFVRKSDWIKSNWWIFLLLLLLLIVGLGYLPCFKKYLPKISSMPNIKAVPKKGGKTKTENIAGKFKKDKASTLIPYIAETAVLCFIPSDADDVYEPQMQLRAAGSNQMLITNASSFSDSQILIDGSGLGSDEGPVPKLSRFSVIETKGSEFTYECDLSEKYDPES